MAVGSLLFVACGQNLPQNTFEPAGEGAELAEDLFFLAFWIAVVIFVLVEGLIVFAAIRYRARRRAERTETPVQTHGNTRLEIVWTVIPALLLVIIGVPTIQGIFALAAKPQGDVVNVKVIGHQWWWEVQYPDLGLVTANELHIPVDRPTFVTLEAKDVLHSFWVPRLAGKQDMVPGRLTSLTLKPTEVGRYSGQCAEFCGLSHANMRFEVVVDDAASFDGWVEDQKRAATEPEAGSPAAEGAQLFQQFPTGSCLACHAVDPAQGGQVGPNLAHLASRERFAAGMFELTPENLARWLRDPPAVKPGSKMPDYNLSEDDIEALVAYLMTLE